MKRQWQIRRTLLARADGQQRWDRAYQQLLIWTVAALPHAGGATSGGREAEGSMRVAMYVRVSTQRQAQTQTIDQQLDRLHASIEEQG